MRIYDTLRDKKEDLSPNGKRINIFVCGPTVYDYQHIGNGKTQLVFDMFVRFLRSEGHKVFYLQNITDIDDKIIARAKERGVSPANLALQFYNIYREDLESLGIKSISKYAHATKYIKQIVSQVNVLLEKGYAYKIDDGYYFNIAKFQDYGKLSRRTASQAEDGVSRIDESVSKINKGDFCLWKFWSGDPSEPYWNTSLGKGRPGWHIEDTAITDKFFGPQYDIHGGGIDLKFPHHEAELSQQEAASGLKPFVRFWMHSGLVSVDGVKMSKSLGNFITIRDFLKKCPAEIFRYMVLMHHYRSPINYTEGLQKQAETSLNSIKEFAAKLEFVKKKHLGIKIGPKKDIDDLIETAENSFKKALQDDFNTPEALGSIFSLMSSLQGIIWSLTAKDASRVKNLIVKKMDIFGIKIKVNNIPIKVVRLGLLRKKSRDNKQFIQSDDLRKEIESLGYRVEDTPLGQFIMKI